MEHDNDNSGDLLMGANAIAATLGITRRQAYRLIYGGMLPTFKLGGTVSARRSSLLRWLSEQETRAAA
ncbi:helix-turn-helix domain-containing protein [Mesorhizobium caraganae]|uniref:helix-turn-helix domain-containing protein n=1 Tax=Mesorhizobium caraganae TaxID=483206 RepID=UPI003ED0F7DE